MVHIDNTRTLLRKYQHKSFGFTLQYLRSESPLYCRCHAMHVPGLDDGHFKVPTLTPRPYVLFFQNLTRNASPLARDLVLIFGF